MTPIPSSTARTAVLMHAQLRLAMSAQAKEAGAICDLIARRGYGLVYEVTGMTRALIDAKLAFLDVFETLVAQGVEAGAALARPELIACFEDVIDLQFGCKLRGAL